MIKDIRERIKLEEMVIDVCYNRFRCSELGIDYCNIKKEDIDKIRDYLINSYFNNNLKGGLR